MIYTDQLLKNLNSWQFIFYSGPSYSKFKVNTFRIGFIKILRLPEFEGMLHKEDGYKGFLFELSLGVGCEVPVAILVRLKQRTLSIPVLPYIGFRRIL